MKNLRLTILFLISGITLQANALKKPIGDSSKVVIDELKKFYTHPAHRELIKNFIKPIVSDMIVVDYEDAAN